MGALPHPTATSVLEVLSRPRLVRAGREFAVAVEPGAAKAAQVRQLEVLWELELGARVFHPEAQGLGAVERLDSALRVVDVFALRDRLVSEFGSYVRSFIRIPDDPIREHVESELDRGLLWPEPVVQPNPSFESCGSEASRP